MVAPHVGERVRWIPTGPGGRCRSLESRGRAAQDGARRQSWLGEGRWEHLSEFARARTDTVRTWTSWPQTLRSSPCSDHHQNTVAPHECSRAILPHREEGMLLQLRGTLGRWWKPNDDEPPPGLQRARANALDAAGPVGQSTLGIHRQHRQSSGPVPWEL